MQIPTKGLQPIWEIMARKGYSITQCLKDTGVSEEQARNPKGQISIEQDFLLHQNLLKLSGQPHLGLELGKVYKPQSWGMLGYAILSAKNVEEIIQACDRFFDLLFSHFQCSFLNKGESYHFILTPKYEIPKDLLPFYIEREFMASQNLANILELSPGTIEEIHLSYKEGSVHDYSKSHFKCKVLMNQKYNAIVFRSSILNQNLPWPDEEAHTRCIESCEELQHKLSGNTSSQVIRYLESNYVSSPSIEATALGINVSVRSLHRALKKEGTSYLNILNNIRLKKSKKYLDEGIPVGQVADLLGYSESSAFSRAFKKWTAISPAEYQSKKR